jgi:hypothetical protein
MRIGGYYVLFNPPLSLSPFASKHVFVFLIDTFGALVIPYVLASSKVVHIEAKQRVPPTDLVLFAFFRPCMHFDTKANLFIFLVYIIPNSVTPGLSRNPLVDQQLYKRCGGGWGRVNNHSEEYYYITHQGLDGGPVVSCCLRAWRVARRLRRIGRT